MAVADAVFTQMTSVLTVLKPYRTPVLTLVESIMVVMVMVAEAVVVAVVATLALTPEILISKYLKVIQI